MTVDLDNLNSATKYPSIETYHALGERGRLTEALTTFDGIDPEEAVYATEKVDGTNIRVVRMPDGDYFIGIREELVYAKGDRIVTNTLDGAIKAALPVADSISKLPDNGLIQVFFMEVYGGKIGGSAKNYTTQGTKGLRLFDIAMFDPEILGRSRESIATWRDNGGQTFAQEAVLKRGADAVGIELTPRLGAVLGGSLPTTLEDTHKWLQGTLPETLVALDASGAGRPEGIVLRTKNRGRIAKARFQDYERTLKSQTSSKKR